MALPGVCVLLLPFIISTTSALNNVYCQPRPTVVTVDPKHHNFFPYFVTLNRCQGSVGHIEPSIKRCAAKSSIIVKVSAFSPHLGTLKDIFLKNHTTCGEECVLDASSCHKNFENWDPSTCSCGCKYPNSKGSSPTCPKDHIWNQQNCRCRCNKIPEICGFRKEWSSDLCRCTCSKDAIKRCTDQNKSVNNDTCSCMDTGAVGHTPEGPGSGQTHLYITLMVLEAVVIVVLISVLIHWIRKKKGYHDQTRNKYHGSQEPLTPRGRGVDSEDGKSKYTSNESFVLDIPPKKGDAQSTAAK